MPSQVHSLLRLYGLLRLSAITVLLLLPPHPSSEISRAVSVVQKAEQLCPCAGTQFLTFTIPRSHLIPAAHKRYNITRNRVTPTILIHEGHQWTTLPLDYIAIVQELGNRCISGWHSFEMRTKWRPVHGSVLLLMPRGLFSLAQEPHVWAKVGWMIPQRHVALVDCEVDRALAPLCAPNGALLLVHHDKLKRIALDDVNDIKDVFSFLHHNKGDHIDSRSKPNWDIQMIHFPKRWRRHLSNICFANPGLSGERFELYVVVHARWCGFCQALMPSLEHAAGNMPDGTLMIFVDDETNQVGVLDHIIDGLPTVIRVVWNGPVESLKEISALEAMSY